MVTPALWEKFCRHTEKVEDEYWHKDGLIEDIVEEILINVEDDDDSSDTSGSDSDDDLGADSDHLHSKATTITEKPTCSKKLKMVPTHLSEDILKSVLPLNLDMINSD